MRFAGRTGARRGRRGSGRSGLKRSRHRWCWVVVSERQTEETMKNEGIEGTEMFQSPGKGSGLRAVRQFAVGELVFACPAYSYVLTVNERGAHCEHCFTR